MAETSTASQEQAEGIDRKNLWVTAYRRYYRLWLCLARSSHASEEDAQDIVHGVIASILINGSPQFESFEHVRNYVAKGVLNRVILHRKQSLRNVPMTEPENLVAEMHQDDAGDEHSNAQGRLLGIVRKLKKKDFEIIKLRYFSGLTFVEISELTGRPVSTLKSREVSALRKIQKAFRKKGITSIYM